MWTSQPLVELSSCYKEKFGTKKLDDLDQLILLELVVDNPGIRLHELQQQLAKETGTEVSCSTICRFLSKSGFSRQKMILAAKQRSDLLIGLMYLFSLGCQIFWCS